jgi:hypothetical protein
MASGLTETFIPWQATPDGRQAPRRARDVPEDAGGAGGDARRDLGEAAGGSERLGRRQGAEIGRDVCGKKRPHEGTRVLRPDHGRIELNPLLSCAQRLADDSRAR